MNNRKVIVGGLAAGTVLIILNILAQILLANRVTSEMNAWIPGAADRISMNGGAIAAGIFMKLIIGIVLVWLYAAIRPRFGPGPRTAAYVAVVAWIFGAIFFSDFPMMGMISVVTYAVLEIVQLVSLLVAVWVGAKIYSE